MSGTGRGGDDKKAGGSSAGRGSGGGAGGIRDDPNRPNVGPLQAVLLADGRQAYRLQGTNYILSTADVLALLTSRAGGGGGDDDDDQDDSSARITRGGRNSRYSDCEEEGGDDDPNIETYTRGSAMRAGHGSAAPEAPSNTPKFCDAAIPMRESLQHLIDCRVRSHLPPRANLFTLLQHRQTQTPVHSMFSRRILRRPTAATAASAAATPIASASSSAAAASSSAAAASLGDTKSTVTATAAPATVAPAVTTAAAATPSTDAKSAPAAPLPPQYLPTHTRMSAPYRAAVSRVLQSHFLPNTRTGREQYEGRVFCGRFGQDGTVFCSASQDGVIHLYDTTAPPPAPEPKSDSKSASKPGGKPAPPPPARWSKIKDIEVRDAGWSIVDTDFSFDSRFVIYSSWSDTVNLANVKGEFELHESLDFQPNGAAARHERGYSGRTCMFGVRFSPDGRDILAGLNGGRVILYDIERKTKLWHADAHTDDVNSVCWMDAHNPNVFATASDDHLVKIWDRRLLRAESAATNTSGAAAMADGTSVDEQFSHKPVGGFIGHFAGLSCVAARGDSRFLLTNGKDQAMKLWDMRLINSPSELTAYAASGRPHFDYRYQSYRRSAMKRHAMDQSLQTYTGHRVQETLIRCNFSPEFSSASKYVYSGSSNGATFIYDILSGEVVSTLSGHGYIVRDVSWHPFQPIIVSSSWDSTCNRYEFRNTSDLISQSAPAATATAATAAASPAAATPTFGGDTKSI